MRVLLFLALLVVLSPHSFAQNPRRLPNPIVRPKTNPTPPPIDENPPVSESPTPPSLRQMQPSGLVWVHQTVDLPQGDGALMTLDGEPLPVARVNNVTLGMVVRAEGLIVARLVGVLPSQPPRDLKVYLPTSTRPLPAQFLGMDAVTELCVLKVESTQLEAVAEAAFDPLPEALRGKLWGFHPLQGQSRTGNFSLTRPRINMFAAQAAKAANDFRYSASNPFYRLAQPQLTLVQDGSVITTNDNKVFGVAVYDITNEISLVYPLTRIQSIVGKIVASKESLAYGWLGATGRSVAPTINTVMSPPKTKQERGVWVDGVVPDSPAEAAGIKVKDILLSVNDRAVETREQLGSVLRQLPPDSEVTIRLKRENQYKIVKARLVPFATDSQQLISKLMQRLEAWKAQLKGMPNTDPQRETLQAKVFTMDAVMKNLLSQPAPPEVKLRAFYGLEVQPMTAALLQHFAVPNGVLVATVNDNSPAARTGLKAGDVITQVDDKKVTDLATLLQLLDAASANAKLAVQRSQTAQTLSLIR